MLRWIAVAFAALLASATVENCGSSSDAFKITSLTLEPANPVVNENVTLTMQYDAPFEINSGTARYSCTLNGLPVAENSDPICKDTPCPIAAGSHTGVSTIVYPKFSGKLDCKTTWTLDNQQLLCFRMVFKS